LARELNLPQFIGFFVVFFGKPQKGRADSAERGERRVLGTAARPLMRAMASAGRAPVEGKGSTLSGIENFSQRREGCTGDLNADCCLAVRTISQRVRIETNIEDK